MVDSFLLLVDVLDHTNILKSFGVLRDGKCILTSRLLAPC